VATQSSTFSRIRRNADGQTMAEYAVILTMITLAIFGALLLLNTSIGSRITGVADLIP
jgi:Flp pilus assembly pilin Flp